MSIKDDLVKEYFMLATILPLSEINQLTSDLIDQPMQLKKKLADVIITELYTSDHAEKAAEHFSRTVQQKVAPEDTLTVFVEKNELTIDELIDLLNEHNLISSKSYGRRLQAQNALYLNDKPIQQSIIFIEEENIIRVGKRKYLKIIRNQK
jgi:tyrosyl-tRNA synthetase